MMCVRRGVMIARASDITIHITLPHITHLTAKPSRMIGVQVGVWCVCLARATNIHKQTQLPV